MELKFIWIKKYKNLENIGFNFSDNKHFEFQNDRLIISEKENIVPKDFYSPTIKNLTAIVGKNGAGKTNFSEFLNYNLAHVRNGGMGTYMKGEGIIVLGNIIFFQEDISIRNQKILEKEAYVFKSFKNAPLDKPDGEVRWHEMEVNKYIYYNPIFDFRALKMDNNFNNISNISTNYLVNNDINLSIKHHNNPKTSFGNNYDTDSLSAHYRNEKIRESDLLLNYPKIKEYVTKLPIDLLFMLDVVKENKLLVRESYTEDEIEDKPERRDKKRMYEELWNLKNYFRDQFLFQEFKDSNDDDLYQVPNSIKQTHFKGLFWVNFFTILIKGDSIVFPDDFFRKFVFNEKYSIDDFSLGQKLEALKSLLLSFVENCEWDSKPINIRDHNDIHNRDNILKIFRTTNYTVDNEEKKNIVISLISETSKILRYEVPFHYQFIHDFSSGEQTLINFYSRFYWAKNEISKKEQSEYGQIGERIIIFIDEGEVSYHPEWQRKYFNMVVNFLTSLFENKDLQLIFTTHSPFVLSDISIENIIFLDKDSNNKTEVKNYGRDKTFGANIYTLLSDSFFMNGTIGEFATQQIEWCIKELDKGMKNIRQESIEKIDFIIDSIGEPLIKMQLEKLRNKSQDASEVTQLRKRLEELENQIKNRKDDSTDQE